MAYIISHLTGARNRQQSDIARYDRRAHADLVRYAGRCIGITGNYYVFISAFIVIYVYAPLWDYSLNLAF